MSLFRTEGTHCYGVEFSPFGDGKIALATSQYFGIVGNGRQYVVASPPGGNGPIAQVRVFETQDGLYDCAWSECNPNQLVSASGDGSVKLWDLNTTDNFPVQNFREHSQECASVDWNLVRKDCFVTSSWDSTLKLWFPERPSSVRTFAEHAGPVYNAIWSPRNPSTFVSCSGDGTIKVWDMNAPRSSCTVAAHPTEVLAVDWNKYNEFGVVTGSVDKTLRVWDLRKPMRPVSRLLGHEFAVRRLKCSPHSENIVGSVSYDMTTMFWNIADGSMVSRANHHNEFVLGLDFDLFHPGNVATCSWDEHMCIFNFQRGPPPQRIPPVPRVRSSNNKPPRALQPQQ